MKVLKLVDIVSVASKGQDELRRFVSENLNQYIQDARKLTTKQKKYFFYTIDTVLGYLCLNNNNTDLLTDIIYTAKKCLFSLDFSEDSQFKEVVKKGFENFESLKDNETIKEINKTAQSGKDNSYYIGCIIKALKIKHSIALRYKHRSFFDYINRRFDGPIIIQNAIKEIERAIEPACKYEFRQYNTSVIDIKKIEEERDNMIKNIKISLQTVLDVIFTILKVFGLHYRMVGGTDRIIYEVYKGESFKGLLYLILNMPIPERFSSLKVCERLRVRNKVIVSNVCIYGNVVKQELSFADAVCLARNFGTTIRYFINKNDEGYCQEEMIDICEEMVYHMFMSKNSLERLLNKDKAKINRVMNYERYRIASRFNHLCFCATIDNVVHHEGIAKANFDDLDLDEILRGISSDAFIKYDPKYILELVCTYNADFYEKILSKIMGYFLFCYQEQGGEDGIKEMCVKIFENPERLNVSCKKFCSAVGGVNILNLYINYICNDFDLKKPKI